MPASTGQTGRGIYLEIGDGESPTGYVTVGNVTAITVSGANAEEIDFTHLLSDGGFREFRQGFKDAGTVGLNFHLDPTDATQAAILADFVSGRVFNARINFSAYWARYMSFSGFIQNPGDIDINVDGPITNNATIRRTGPTIFETIP